MKKTLISSLSIIIISILAVSQVVFGYTLEDDPDSGYYQSEEDINTEQPSCTVNSGKNVWCISPGRITLLPGFRAVSGSKFGAIHGYTDVPEDQDIDTDSLPDWWELVYFDGDIGYGAADDPDGDLLSNMNEYLQGSDPMLEDTDGDDLDDYEEYMLGTNPSNSDTDGDGYNDGMEVAFGANPNDIDDMPGVVVTYEYYATGSVKNAVSVIGVEQ